MLTIHQLKASYGSIQVLHGIDLTIAEGQIVAIVGANGAGKSTLLKAITGMLGQRWGTIDYQGQNLIGMPAHRIVSRGVSLVPEGRQLFASLNVEDNILLGAFLYQKRRHAQVIAQRKSLVYELFPVLAQRTHQLAGTLSGGEQQMLAIGRALMAGPRLLLLDEPSMGIAPLIVSHILDAIKKLNQEGTTILLVEQNVKAALQIAHYGYVLERGEVTLEGIATELLNDSNVKKAYLGG